MRGKKRDVFRRISSHLAICEWGLLGTEKILADVLICREKNLGGISALTSAVRVLGNLASGTKIFAFSDDPENIPDDLAEKNIAIQLFVTPDSIDSVESVPGVETIIALSLADTEHLDWGRIIFAGNKANADGFMFIDQDGRHLHKFYDFLNLVGEGFSGAVHYCAGSNDISRLEDAHRLVEKIRPDLLPGLLLFVNGDFFKNLDFNLE